MSEDLSISVIICANDTNRMATLQEAVASVAGQTRPPMEMILVIDNNHHLYQLAKEQFSDAKVIENKHTRGLSGARNTGLDVALGNIVAFLDDDAAADPSWLEAMCRHYDEDMRVLGAGGLTLPNWPGDLRPKWFPPEFNWVVGCTPAGAPKHLAEIRNPIGCNMSLRRSVFELTGGFADDLGRKSASDTMGCEETELFIRVATTFPGCRILFEPAAVVHHVVSPHRCSWGYFMRRCIAEGRGKAALVAKQGTRHSLASERQYVGRLLPAAVARGVTAGIVRLDRHRLSRSAAMVAGLSVAAGSYLLRRMSLRRNARRTNPRSYPIQVVDLDLDGEPKVLAARHPISGQPYRGAFCLVRRSGKPVSIVELPLYGEDIKPDQIRSLSQLTSVNPRPTVDVVSGSELPPAGVLIATRDRPETLARCLESVLAQDYPPAEVVVVDNAPSDGQTHQLVHERYSSNRLVRYVREDQPGLGKAHNTGLSSIGTPVVAVTDDDVVADRRWLLAHCRNFGSSDRIGCVTGLILPAELETRGQYWTECHGGFGKGFERRVFDEKENRPPDRLFPFAAGKFGSGANMAFRVAALRAAGGFDDALGAGTPAKGGDDLAAFVAIIRAGHQLVYEPEAIVWHLHRQKEEAVSRQAYGYGVGLGAYLTKTVLEDPSTLAHFITASPWAIAHLVGPSSSKNRRLPEGFPKRIRRVEQVGVAMGAPLYLYSRYWVRRSKNRLQRMDGFSQTSSQYGDVPARPGDQDGRASISASGSLQGALSSGVRRGAHGAK